MISASTPSSLVDDDGVGEVVFTPEDANEAVVVVDEALDEAEVATDDAGSLAGVKDGKLSARA